jgi:hypothetical protein
MTVTESTTVAIAFSLGLLTTPVKAQEVIKRCAGVEVHSIHVSYELARNTPLNEKSKTIEISPPVAGSKDVTIVARGPILGSMDSTTIKTEFSCTGTGFILAATISRSEYYNGVVAQNQIWLPKISMVVTPRAPEVVFEAVWKMGLTNGKEVDRARTPPYPDQKYPIAVTKTLRSASSQTQ